MARRGVLLALYAVLACGLFGETAAVQSARDGLTSSMNSLYSTLNDIYPLYDRISLYESRIAGAEKTWEAQAEISGYYRGSREALEKAADRLLASRADLFDSFALLKNELKDAQKERDDLSKKAIDVQNDTKRIADLIAEEKRKSKGEALALQSYDTGRIHALDGRVMSDGLLPKTSKSLSDYLESLKPRKSPLKDYIESLKPYKNPDIFRPHIIDRNLFVQNLNPIMNEKPKPAPLSPTDQFQVDVFGAMKRNFDDASKFAGEMLARTKKILEAAEGRVNSLESNFAKRESEAADDGEAAKKADARLDEVMAKIEAVYKERPGIEASLAAVRTESIECKARIERLEAENAKVRDEAKSLQIGI